MFKVIKVKQQANLKSYINMNTKLCKNSKNDFEKHSFQVVEELSSQKYCGKCEKT